MKKTVLITGANRGIGLAASKKFLQEGYHVILGIRDLEKGKQTVNELNSDEVSLVQLDVGKKESVLAAMNEIKSKFDKLDVLINNAAINYDTWHNALDCDMKEIMETIQVNLIGAWGMVHAMVSLLEKSEAASIINMSSGAGAIDSITGSTPGYSVSKAALNVLTINMSHSLPSNIKINAMCPGWVRTDMGGASATRSAEEAANDMFELAESREFNGKFIRYGKVIPF